MSHYVNIPNDAQIAVIGSELSQTLLARKKLQALGLKGIKEFERGVDALKLLEARDVDVLYIVGRPKDMDALTFIRAARSGPVQSVAPIFTLSTIGTGWTNEEKEFLRAYQVRVVDGPVDSDKTYSTSLREVFVDRADSDSTFSRLARAKELLREGIANTAESIYEDLLRESEDNLPARIGLLRATAGKPEKQWQELQRLIAKDPYNYSFKFQMLDRYVQAGATEKAEALLAETLAEIETNSEIFWLNELGLVCVGMKVFPFCLRIADRIRALAPSNRVWLADLLLSRTHLASGNTKDALRFLLLAEKGASGRHAEIENIRGILARKNGDYEDAIDRFRSALTLSPDDYRLAYNIGICCEKLGKPDEAREHFKAALRLSPTFLKAKVKLF